MSEPCPMCGRIDIAFIYKMGDDEKPYVDFCMGCNPYIAAYRLMDDMASSYPDASTIKIVRIPKPDPEEAE